MEGSRPDENVERYATIAVAVAGHAALPPAIAALEALPPGARFRGALAAALIERLLPRDANWQFAGLRRLGALVAIADADPPAHPSWRRTRALARAFALATAAAGHELFDPGAALAEIDELATEVAGDRPAAVLLESARLAISIAQGVTLRDDPVQSEAWARMKRFLAAAGPAAEPLGEVLASLQELSSDPGDDFAAKTQRLQAAAARLPADSPVRTSTEHALSQMGLGAGPPPVGGEALSAAEHALGEAAGGMFLLRPDAEPTEPEMAEGLRRLRTAVAASPAGHPQRPFHLLGLALGLTRRSEQTNGVADLPEAERLLVEARGLIRGPQDGLWPLIHGLLAEVRERLGSSGEATADAVEGLRTYLWQVLMQPDAVNANVVARDAASSALSAARRCMRRNDPAGAVRALDAGRGLALYAATEMRSVPDRLTQAGRSDLAERWREASAASRPPAELRREMIAVLSATAPGGAPLDPPSTAQIRQALTALDLDALVYLMPAGEGSPGYGVAVPADGPLAYVGLPYLRPDTSPEVEAYLGGARRRDSVVVGRGAQRDMGALDEEFADRLDVVCDWAWRAAMGPLIDSLLPALRRRAPGRVPRLVLIPMGELALIPWQAARRSGGEPAVRSVALSQAASARLLCHSATRPTVPASRIALVVGDPDTGGAALPLPGARAEAYEIRRRFYRGGRYLGRRPGDDEPSPSGAGTPEQVRAWLADRGPAAGTTLHLACHGVVDPAAATSHLLLAGGERLAADQLVDLMTGVPDRVVDLVVLAACSTGLAAGAYDEAYSLGTAFLAAGACSVLSTLWTIPDAGTSLLMFMFHHYRVTGGRPVWEALHLAQLWMIDPDRVEPETMPGSLSRQIRDTDPAEVTAWAGFLHGGR